MELSLIPVSQKAKSMNEVLERINFLFKMQNMIPDWGKDNAIEIKYMNFNTILVFSKEDKLIDIKIYSNDREEMCLSLTIGESLDGIVGSYIEQIAIDDKCPIPKNNGGTWLVSFSKTLLCTLGIKRTELDDDASIQCQHGYAKLILLRAFQGNYSSWYGNFGFKITKNTSKSMKSLRYFAVSNIMSELKSLSSTKPFYILDPVEKAIVFTILQTSLPYEILGDFMLNLWKANCEKYLKVQSLLMYSSGSWSKYIDEIFSDTHLINNDICRESL